MKKEIITYRDPKSPISEIFRTLRTNIQFANTKRGLQSVLVTSTSPGEGKSWVSSNLAVAFAQAGKKVILVDCDMRKGRLFSIFGVSPTPGLSNFLSGINSDGEDSSTNILSYIKETEVENLYLITAGNIPPNPSELLVSEQMIDVIEELKSICDLVIFDGTPSSLVTDAIIISRYVDTTLIVSSYKNTRMDELEKVKKDIENVGGKIAGVVINKMPVSQKQYYATYYYGNSNLNMKNDKKVAKVTKEEAFLIEKRKEELIEKSKNIMPENKIEEKNKESAKIEKTLEEPIEDKATAEVAEKKTTKRKSTSKTSSSTKKIKNEEKPNDVEQKSNSDIIDSKYLLSQMDKYIDEEKARLKKGDK